MTISLDLLEIKPSYNWRFNPTLLLDVKFCDQLTKLLAEFLKFNDTGKVSDSTLWESLKAVLRGQIISYESRLKKQRVKRLLEIDNSLTRLEDAYWNSAELDVLNEITALKLEYNLILSNQVNNTLFKVKQKQFELGDKPDKLLSRQLRGLQATRAIHKIKNKNVVLTNPSEINDTFK